LYEATLPISKGYLLNGNISIETEPGRGTEIIIEIPLI